MLKRFDLFPKLNEENRRTTSEGGIISLIGIIVGFLLFINETIQARAVTTLERLELFENEKPNLSIHLEMNFFHLTCQQVSLQASSTSTNPAEQGTSVTSVGSWSVRSVKTTPISNDEGCFIVAQVDIVKYESGEMHVALSPHLLDFGNVGITLEEYFKYNTSHQITSFAIGNVDDNNYTPQEFVKKTVPEKGTGRYVYDFNVVPQTAIKDDKVISQYMIQCREQDVVTIDENEGMFALQRLGLPGVFITVQLSMLMVNKINMFHPWYEYVIALLGIVGGTSTVIAFFDSVLHEVLWKKKLD
jgi:hypothetical protein